MALANDEKLQLAYDSLKKEVISSKIYKDFINRITSNPLFIKKTNGIYIEDFINNSDDLDFIYEVSNMINMEDDFSFIIISSVKSDDKLLSVIKTKILETYYGNTIKIDIDANDELFNILQNVLGLDTLIKSVYNPNILYDSFSDINEFRSFVEKFNSLYELVIYEKNHDRIIDIINDSGLLVIEENNAKHM